MTAFFYWDVISWALSLMLSDRYVNNDGFFCAQPVSKYYSLVVLLA